MRAAISRCTRSSPNRRHSRSAHGGSGATAADRGRRLLGEGEAGVLGRHELLREVFFAVWPGLIERVGVVRGRRPHGLPARLRRDRACVRELVDRGVRPSRPVNRSPSLFEPQAQLLDRGRRAHRPAQVPEVALELTENGRHREGGERNASRRIERSTALTRPIAATCSRCRLARVRYRTPRPGRAACGAHELVAVRGSPLAVIALEQPHRLMALRAPAYRSGSRNDEDLKTGTRAASWRERCTRSDRRTQSRCGTLASGAASLRRYAAFCRHRLSGLYRCGLAIDMDPSRDWSSRRGTFRRDDRPLPVLRRACAPSRRRCAWTPGRSATRTVRPHASSTIGVADAPAGRRSRAGTRV